MVNLGELTSYMDQWLDLKSFTQDKSNNGLQIQGKEHVKKIVFGVDISQAIIDKAIASRADMIFVHHGISWGDSLKYITGNNYARISALIKNNISLYAAHLPLDAHPEAGHNAMLAMMLNLNNICGAFNFWGMDVGCVGELDEPVSARDLASAVNDNLDTMLAEYSGENPGKEAPYIFDSGRPIKTVGIVSGGGGFTALSDAVNMNIDCLVTGEFNHSMYFFAKESGMSVISCGHYRTEVPGLIAVMGRLSEEFNVTTEFINVPTGL